MVKKVGITLFLFLMASEVSVFAAPAVNPHADRINKYEGPQTCLTCHSDAAKEVVVSLH